MLGSPSNKFCTSSRSSGGLDPRLSNEGRPDDPESAPEWANDVSPEVEGDGEGKGEGLRELRELEEWSDLVCSTHASVNAREKVEVLHITLLAPCVNSTFKNP